jgi:two-component system LytT family sensor kinase
MLRSGIDDVSALNNDPSLVFELVESQRSALQKLGFLDRIIPDFIFKSPAIATRLLSIQHNLSCFKEFPDYQIKHFGNLGFLNNQQYSFRTSISAYSKARNLIELHGDISQQVSINIDIAGPLINLQYFDEAIECLDRAKHLLQNSPSAILTARLLCREAYLDLHLKKDTSASQYFLESERILLEQRSSTFVNTYFLNLVQSGLGRIAEAGSEWDKALMYYLQIVERLLEDDIHSRLCWHYLNIGRCYAALDKCDQARDYFYRAINEEVDSSPKARASAYANLGFLENDECKFEAAIVLYEHAEQIFRSQESPEYFNVSNTLRWKAKAKIELGKGEEGLQLLMDSHAAAKSAGSFQLKAEIYKDLASYFAEQADFKNAYEYQLLHEQSLEKHTEQYNQEFKIGLEVRYQTEQKKRETEMLKLKATQLQLKALSAQMNPHFLYNALNAIQHYITSNEVKNATKYLAEFAHLIRKSLEYSDLEIISLEKEIDFLDNYLSINQKLRFEDQLEYEIIVDDDIEEDILGVPTMIVQPYVENSIEHGLRSIDKGKIRIHFKMLDENNIVCEILDNGIGRLAAAKFIHKSGRTQVHRSMGTMITENRLELLHEAREKKIYVETIDLLDKKTGFATGTKVLVQIPVVEVQIR